MSCFVFSFNFFCDWILIKLLKLTKSCFRYHWTWDDIGRFCCCIISAQFSKPVLQPRSRRGRSQGFFHLQWWYKTWIRALSLRNLTFSFLMAFSTWNSSAEATSLLLEELVPIAFVSFWGPNSNCTWKSACSPVAKVNKEVFD